MTSRATRARAVGLLGLSAAWLLGMLALTTRTVETHPRISTTLVWNKDIAPILQRKCFTCHTPFNIAFSLASYADARPWAAAIREESLERHMPIWAAAPGYGRFANDPSLTQNELDLIVAWADGGAPSGQTLEEDQLPFGPVAAEAMWDAGAPSATATLAAHQVDAGASPVVHRTQITAPFTAPTRVHGLAFRPGNRRVVRYATVRDARTNRWLFTWTPWSTAVHFPESSALVLPARAALVVEVGYVGTESAVTDESQVGFYTGAAGGTGVVTADSFAAPAVTVAPGAAQARTRGEWSWPETSALQALWIDPAEGVTSVEVSAYLPDGSVRPLLWLREPSARWPSPYVYDDPVPLPRGARLRVTAYVASDGTTPRTVAPEVHLLRVPTTASTF